MCHADNAYCLEVSRIHISSSDNMACGNTERFIPGFGILFDEARGRIKAGILLRCGGYSPPLVIGQNGFTAARADIGAENIAGSK